MAEIVTTLVVPAQITTTLLPSPQVSTTLVNGQGPAGPPGAKGDDGDVGPQGPPGTDKNYKHEQMVPSVFWTINHGLGKYPNIQAFDSSGAEIEGHVRHVSVNVATIEYSVVTGGEAYCN